MSDAAAERAALADRITAEESAVVFDRFDAEDAWKLGSLLRSIAVERGLGIAIDVTLGEQLLFFSALPGTSAHNRKWIERKKATVREWGLSSYLVGLRFPQWDPPYELETAPWMDVTRYTSSGGGFPIRIRNVGVVGTVSVSGLRHDLDHALLVEACTRYIAETAAG